MFKRILSLLGGGKRKSGKATRKNIVSNRRHLRHEHLEDRCMLATLTVNVSSDGPVDPINSNLTLREAISYVNGTAQPGTAERANWINETVSPLGRFDEIVIAPHLTGATIQITGGTLEVLRRVTIIGPVDPANPANRVSILKHVSSTATEGFRFSNFDLAPSSGFQYDTGVSNLRIVGFNVGVKLENLSSTTFDVNRPFRLTDNVIFNVSTGIHFDNADVPFHIEKNSLSGISISNGSGILLNNSGQFATSGALVQNLSTKPTIGRSDGGSGNTIGDFEYGIRIVNSTFPDLRISGNTIGAENVGGTFQPEPNRIGISLDNFTGPGFSQAGADRIDNNSIVHNTSMGININHHDSVVIENNLIQLNASNGISLGSDADFHVIQSNTFDRNGGDGISIATSAALDAGQGVKITRNQFLGMSTTSNVQRIDLGTTGPQTNDSGDTDPGPNALQNYPVVQSLTLNGDVWTAQVSLIAQYAGDYQFDFYRYDPARRNFVFLRSQLVNVPSSSPIPFTFTNKVELGDGDQLGVVAINRAAGTVDATSELSLSSLFSFTLQEDDPPQIVDVRMRGSSWVAGHYYSFASAATNGKQYRPLFTQGVNTIEIQFSEDVNINNGLNQLLLAGSPSTVVPQPVGFVYDAIRRTGIWTLSEALSADKYALRLGDTQITDDASKRLDGEWDQPIAPSNVLANKDDIGNDWNLDPKTLLSGNNLAGGEFRLHFAYLPADYNQDGRVASGETGGDGDGDNLPGQSGDAAVVISAIDAGKTSLVAGRFRGDYNDNEIVDGYTLVPDGILGDYQVWSSTFGSTDDLRADGNGNGTIDAADYSVWREYLGAVSAWSSLSGGIGSGSVGGPVVLFNEAPRVANVTISGSQSTHPAFSFNGPNDSTDFDGSGIQLRTVPVGGADTVKITFTEDVNVVASNLTLVGLRSANRPTLASFSYDVFTMTATWRFEGWALGDHYAIALSDAVTDIEGNALDGEWTNPRQFSTVNAAVSEFPSGNGYAGGRFNFVATMLPGDANLDLVVNELDQSILVANYGSLYGMLFIQGDFTGNGGVTNPDVGKFGANWYADLNILWIKADLNGDFAVDGLDMAIFNDNFGMSNPTQAQGDLNGDGSIDVNDLDLMFALYGLHLAVVS